MNNFKPYIYVFLGFVFFLQTSAYTFLSATAVTPSDAFGLKNAATTTGKLESDALEVAIQKYVNWLMTFLYLIAVMYALWGGFQILTANGDEEKVKKGKTILIQAALGLFIIFIAGAFVSFILRILAN